MHIHVNVYLRTSPTMIMEHLYKRGQTGDEKITLQDLADLHEKHEEYVNTLDDVIIIEVKNLNELEKNADELLSKLRQRIYI